MTPCLPPPPPPVEVHADTPTASVPLPTLQWLAARDLHAERATACYLEAVADGEDLRADVVDLRHALSVAEQRADGWERVARRRPGWGVVVGALGVGVAVGAAGVVVVATR